MDCLSVVVLLLGFAIFFDNADGLVLNDTLHRYFRTWNGFGAATSIGGSQPSCRCDCGLANKRIRAKRVIGGSSISPHQYPWLTSILYNSKFHCGGSLINKDYVLTAAHCVVGVRGSKLQIGLGEHNLRSRGSDVQVRGVSDIKVHPSYNPESIYNDIALLRLNRPVDFSRAIRPVCLPSTGMRFGGKTGTVVGWGHKSRGGDVSQDPQKVDLPILDHRSCRKTAYDHADISGKMICAGGNGGKDACQKDSGGPLLVQKEDGNYVLAGLVSWGHKCGQHNYPGVYTDVAKYHDWIMDNMRDTCVCRS